MRTTPNDPRETVFAASATARECSRAACDRSRELKIRSREPFTTAAGVQARASVARRALAELERRNTEIERGAAALERDRAELLQRRGE